MRCCDVTGRVRNGRPRAAVCLTKHPAQDAWHGDIVTLSQRVGRFRRNRLRRDPAVAHRTTRRIQSNESVTLVRDAILGMRARGNHPVGEPQTVSTFPLVFALFFLTIEGIVVVGHGRLEFGRRVFARRILELPGAYCNTYRESVSRSSSTSTGECRSTQNGCFSFPPPGGIQESADGNGNLNRSQGSYRRAPRTPKLACKRPNRDKTRERLLIRYFQTSDSIRANLASIAANCSTAPI